MDWVLFYLVHMYGHLSTNLPIKHTAGPHLVVVAVRELVALRGEAVERVRQVQGDVWARVFVHSQASARMLQEEMGEADLVLGDLRGGRSVGRAASGRSVSRDLFLFSRIFNRGQNSSQSNRPRGAWPAAGA